MTVRPPGTSTGFGPDRLELHEGLAADSSRACWQAHRSVHDEQVGGPARAVAAALPVQDQRLDRRTTGAAPARWAPCSRNLDGRGSSTMQQGAPRTAARGCSRNHPRVEVLRLTHLAVGQERESGPWPGSAACLEVVTTPGVR